MDQIFICKDCGEEFIFTSREVVYYSKKNLLPPKRCKWCRLEKKDVEARMNVFIFDPSLSPIK